jgi:CTD kinase subunit beta
MEESSFSVPNNNASNTAITTGLSYRRHYRPYYTKRQLLALGNIRRLGSLAAKETSARYSSCKFMQDVGRKLGL